MVPLNVEATTYGTTICCGRVETTCDTTQDLVVSFHELIQISTWSVYIIMKM